VISFWFKGRGNSPIEHAVYYKIKVNHGSITTFYKKITEEDIWDKPNCRFYTVFSKEPEFGIHTCVTSNVVGSPENFIIFDLPKNKKKFDKKVKLLERHWRNRFEEFKSSTPCGEIYFNIY